ncbi:cuticle protein CP14.6-like [Bradysia coprophila]|uniref:cuticle protein CP14.6-like n=1 Tax=Bradysia coprophila TaxID=38358 RepID=UPI00187DB993|nr:cuticle protein CP14.6-like [Bradysia coprophila]
MLGEMVVMEIILAVVFSGSVFTAPTNQNVQVEPEAVVVQFENKSNETGTYSIKYEMSNGIIHYETGSLSNDSHHQAQNVEGTYWFVGPDNITYEINYSVFPNLFSPHIGKGTGISFKLLQSSIG